MSDLSFFTRLASYSQNPAKTSIENFTTEVLAHLFNNDAHFRRVFSAFIAGGKRMPWLTAANADTQQPFPN